MNIKNKGVKIMNKTKIDFLKESLQIKGYEFNNISDFGIEINYPKCKVIIWETIQDTLFLKIIDNNHNTILKRTYKSINNLIKYGLKNII
jgi:hypothetical protein